MTTWQPIETAPTDWQDVLVYSPDHASENCEGVFSAFCDGEQWFTFAPGDNVRLYPSHWQPLPKPPIPDITSIAQVSPRLKPCPFCGSSSLQAFRIEQIHFVQCERCDTEQAGRSEKDAFTAWNRRA